MKKIDKFFLGITLAIIILGLIIFVSASFGILAKSENAFYDIVFKQIIFGLGGGIIAMYFCIKIPYKFWRKYSIYFFLASIVLTALVFVPHLGIAAGGAKRWVSILGYSFQPVEFLKIAFIIYLASFFSLVKNKIQDFKFSIIPFFVMIGLIALVLLKQPDTKSLILMFTTGLAMLFAFGGKLKYILGFFVLGVIGFIILVSIKPYVLQRVKTFIDPASDPRGASYQLQQSLIAVGSGGLFGRGLGQSIQKFNYLPEPQGDSIFAVFCEELGFVGSCILICLFLVFALRGYRIAHNAPDPFGKILVIGLITIIILQAFMNIASIVGVFPLTGVPLPFISHGGTSLMIYMAVAGIILNVSKSSKGREV